MHLEKIETLKTNKKCEHMNVTLELWRDLDAIW